MLQPMRDPDGTRPAARRAGSSARAPSAFTARGSVFALLLVYAGAMPVVVAGVGFWFLPDITGFFDGSALWTVPLFVVITAVALALALAPATVMSALAGVVFGPLGLVPAVGGYLIASLALFELVRRVLQPAVQAAIARSPRGRAAQAELERATFRIVVLSRLSPVLPFALASVLLAVSAVTRPTYVAGTAVGMLPRTAAAVAVGDGAERTLSALREGQSLPGGGTALGPALPVLTTLATVGLLWYAARAIRRSLAVDRPAAPAARGMDA
jgi:uncharacterized membrane protein YdjX (TVP38/TMEM64 family)